jgi:hypothetical protein
VVGSATIGLPGDVALADGDPEGRQVRPSSVDFLTRIIVLFCASW